MNKFNFEKALDELSEIVSLLESGNMPIDEALEKFEKGIKLSAQCNKYLEEAEKKVEILIKKGDGTYELRNFDDDKNKSGELF